MIIGVKYCEYLWYFHKDLREKYLVDKSKAVNRRKMKGPRVKSGGKQCTVLHSVGYVAPAAVVTWRCRTLRGR